MGASAEEGEPSRRPRGLSVAIAAALGGLLVFVDAFWLNQGLIALLVAAWAVVVGLPRALGARKFAGFRRRRAAVVGIYFASAVLVFSCNWANNLHAQAQAERVIAAVEAYHADHRRYPGSLEDLVPKYLPAVPRAKYTLGFNEFVYRADPERATLQYVRLPPFGRPYYVFQGRKWGYLD